MTQERINNEYFEWLSDIVCGERFSNEISYRKLLSHLHSIIFRYSIPRDANRAGDGLRLRYRFILRHDYDREYKDYIEGPCSVLEMMVALALRCEEDIMDNPSYGDRIGQWFWGMITNLGLRHMDDTCYDEEYVEQVIDRFLDREYEPDGTGGLFRIRHCASDLRNVEIWYQLCWYLDSFV